MNRRRFLQALVAVPAAAVAAAQKASTPALAFHSKAFVSMFNPNGDTARIERMDVLYGWGCVAPGTACRIENELYRLDAGDADA